MTARKPIDDRRHINDQQIDDMIRREWHGPLSLRVLADRAGCSHSTLQRRAASLGFGNVRPKHEARPQARGVGLDCPPVRADRDPGKPRRESYANREWMEDEWQIQQRKVRHLLDPLDEGLTEAEALLVAERFTRRTA